MPQIGLGFAPFYRYAERPGCFALLGIHTRALGLILDLPRIRRSQPMRRDKCISVVARSARLESDEPFNYTIDGDLYRNVTDLTLETGPRLRLVVP